MPIESPYTLKDQTLSSVIRVKALDKAGNERTTVLIPDDSIRRMDRMTMSLLVGGGFFLALVLAGIVWFVVRKRRSSNNETLEI